MNKEELAVEVAEKVWGWSYRIATGEEEWGSDRFCELNDKDEWVVVVVQNKYYEQLFKDDLTQYVFSWEGFGRTAEAMAKLKQKLHIPIDADLSFYSKDKGYIYVSDYGWDPTIPTSLIESTHRAALEAVNND